MKTQTAFDKFRNISKCKENWEVFPNAKKTNQNAMDSHA